MTTRWTQLRRLATTLALPVAGLGISYAMLVDVPLRSKIGEARAELAKLNETVQRRAPEHTLNTRALDQLEQSRHELNKLVVNTPQPPVEIERELATESLLSQLSATVALFGRHQLSCLASQRETDSQAELQTLGNRSGGAARDHRNIRLTLSGSFSDMHSAIVELQSEMDRVSIQSLEMESSPTGSSLHRWEIVLRIKGN